MTNDVVPVHNQIEEVNDKIKKLLKFDSDFEKSRENIMTAIETGQTALNEVSVLASQSGSFKDYEALSHLIKTLIDANRTLLDLHQISSKIESATGLGKKDKDGVDQIKNYGNTNIIMVGSSKDILSLLNNKNITLENEE
jgi:hypothetical protein